MAGLSVFGFTFWRSAAENDLRDLFENYKSTLDDQKLKTSNRIRRWADELIQDIEKHVYKQQCILEREYESQLYCLEEKQDDFVNAIRTCEKVNNNESVQSLLEICRSLTFELSHLEYHHQSIEFIKLTSKESADINQNRNDPEELQIRSSRKNLTEENDYQIRDSSSESSDASFNITTTQISPQRLTNYNNLADGSIPEKCPACFMLFPSTMTVHEVTEHVHEHYSDD
ncbi:hypothetical protein I4U23_024107 [Adineta vaga]|nr:hypothetical protein I4U23_024107 [Adineta vaga]